MAESSRHNAINEAASSSGQLIEPVGKHINNCFREGELNADVVCANFAHTTTHGAIEGKVQVHSVTFYNLDVIISVGYRVKSVKTFIASTAHMTAFCLSTKRYIISGHH